MNSFPPPYGHGAVHGISNQVDELIIGQAPSPYLNSCAKTSHLTNMATIHKSKLSPLAKTRDALQQVFCSRERGWPASKRLRVMALMTLPAAIAHDLVKPPYYLSRMAVASSRIKHERKKVENDVVDEILESLSISLEVVLKMVARLGLETPEGLQRQVREGGFCLFLTLGRLLEAYGSRFAPAGTVYLASRKRLQREHCSGIARLHFDQIHRLKDDLRCIGFLPTQTLPDAAAAIEEWLPRILQELNGNFVDRDENRLFCSFLQRLRKTEDEMRELILPSSHD